MGRARSLTGLELGLVSDEPTPAVPRLVGSQRHQRVLEEPVPETTPLPPLSAASTADMVRLVDVGEACQRLGGIDPLTLHKEAEQGRIHPTRVRGRVLYALLELDRYVRENTR